MTRTQVSERFGLDDKKLLYYEQNGLFVGWRRADGTMDYGENMPEYISLVDLLLKSGLDISVLKSDLADICTGGKPNEAQLKILLRQRYALLEDIHDRESILNRLDFVIRKFQNKNKGEKA